MKQLRVGVFETNSSSTHSLVIARGQFSPASLPLEGGVCTIYPGEFGWGPEEYKDAPTKAAYCLTWLKTVANTSVDKEEMLKRVVSRVTGAKTVVFAPADSGYYPSGYIDHQSSDVGAEAFKSEETLKRFIFNPSSILIIDNDNH